ncbi:MAG: leucyl aminopeptidase, partial [Sedimenticola sp.]|nr:leucyl aminopeptidase [Sedimenticola sp.]MCW8946743.1 leucyl aminopeptidase [Sedimenticola sp.]MCW9022101.1 leucyl aminopeptidase [Sedimenticola sp.]
MEYHLKSGDLSSQRTACLVLGVFTKRRLSDPAAAVDLATDGQLSDILKKGDMDGETGQSLMLYHVSGIQAERVLLIGLGEEKAFNLKGYLTAWGSAVKQLNESSVIEATNALSAIPLT